MEGSKCSRLQYSQAIEYYMHASVLRQYTYTIEAPLPHTIATYNIDPLYHLKSFSPILVYLIFNGKSGCGVHEYSLVSVY